MKNVSSSLGMLPRIINYLKAPDPRLEVIELSSSAKKSQLLRRLRGVREFCSAVAVIVTVPLMTTNTQAAFSNTLTWTGTTDTNTNTSTLTDPTATNGSITNGQNNLSNNSSNAPTVPNNMANLALYNLGVQAALLPTLTTLAASSVTYTNAAVGNWSSNATWSNGVAPTNNDTTSDYLFSLAGGGLSTNNLTGLGFTNFTFGADAGAYQISGSSLTNMSGGGITNLSFSLQSLYVSLSLQGASTMNTANGNLLIGTNGTNSGTISGAGNITKTGSGTLILTSSNSYNATGAGLGAPGTRINQGTVAISNSYALGTAKVTFASNNTTLLALTNLNVTNSIDLTANGIIDSGAFTLTNSGVISGAGALTKAGAGTTVLSSSNSYSGGTTLNAGTLALSNSYALGTGMLTFASNSTTLKALANLNVTNDIVLTTNGSIDSGAFTLTNSGVISGAGALTKAGAGTVVLSSSNSYSGGTTVSAGTLAVSNTYAFGATNAALNVSGGTLNNASYNAVVGAVTLGNGSITGAGTLTGTSYTATNTGAALISESLAGSGTFTQSGAGTTTLSASNSYSGGTTISAGTLAVSNTYALGATNAVLNVSGGTLNNVSYNAVVGAVTVGNGSITGAGTLTGLSYTATNTAAALISESLAGNGGFAQSGAGTTTLSASNTYSQGTTLNSGMLAISNNYALGTGTVTFASNSTTLKALANLNVTNNIVLTTNGSIDSGAFTLTNSGVISGAGALTKAGTGTTMLTSSNTHTGGTTISAGAVAISNSYALGTGTVTFASNSTTLNALASMNVTNDIVVSTLTNTIDSGAFTLTNSGVISGAGALTKAGTGTTVLSSSNSYSGGTTIRAGTLLFLNVSSLYGGNSSLWTAANIIVGSNATAAFVVGGASSFTTSNITTLLGNLTTVNSNGLQAGSFIGFDTTAGAFTLTNNFSNSTGTGGGAIGLSKLGTGTLTLSGSNSYSGATTVEGGQLYVTGSISNAAALTVGSNNSGIGMVISGGGTVQNAAGTIGYTTTSSNNSVLVTGVGSLWSNSAALLVGNQGSGNSLVISNGGKVANVSGEIGSSNTSSNNSVLVTGTGSLWTNGSTWTGNKGSGNSLVISNGAVVRDTFAYIGFATNSSNNSVLVTGSNSQLINATAVKLGYAGSGNSLVISNGARVSGINGTVGETTNTATNNLLMVTGTGSQLNLSGGMTFGWAGGGNSLVISNGGTMTSVNTYIGNNASASNNSVLVTDTGSSWTNTFNLTFWIGSSSAGNSLVISNGGKVVTAGAGLGQYATSSNNSVMVTGSGSLFSNGASLTIGSIGGGTVTVANGGSIAGGTTIAASNGSTGTLNIGSFGGSDTAGSITGSIGFGSGTGMINFNQTDSNTLTNIISGAGSVNQLGTGTTTLTGANTYSGVTTISAGALQIGNGGASGSLGSGAVTDNASLIFNRSNALNVTNIISGTGNLTQAGTGTTTLSGSNSYTGTTAITAGTLLFSNATSLYGGSNAYYTAANIIVGSNATAAFGVGGASSFTTSNITTLLGNLSTVNSNGLQAGSFIGFDTTAGAFTLTNNVSNSTGTGGGAIGLSKLGTGTLILSGSNSYSGGTTIRAGVLTMGNVSALGSSNNAVTDNGTLDLNSNNASMAGLSGSGTIINSAGTNNLTLGNNNGSGTFTGSISNAIALIKNGTGTQTLSGSNAYSQGTTLNAGTLLFSNATSLYRGSNANWTAANIIVSSNATAAFGVGGASSFTTSNVTTLLGNLTTVTNNGFQDGSFIGFDTTAGAFTLTNVVSNSTGTGGGSLGLSKLGIGTLTLTSSNTYSGGTMLNAGTVALSNSYALGAGTVTFASISTTLKALANLNVTNKVALTTNGVIDSGAFTLTNSGVISGVGALIKAGAGTTVLTSSNTYSGGTTLNAGALALSNSFALGTGTVTFASNSTIQAIANLTLTNAFSIAASTVGTFDSGSFVLTNSGSISGSGSLTKAGAGTMVLSGSNNFTEATTISNGAVRVSNANGLGATNGGTTVLAGAALEVDGGIAIGAEALTLSNNGISSSGALRSISGANTYGGLITLGTSVAVGVDADSLTLNGGVAPGAGSSFTKVGAGTLILNSTSTATGIVTISGGTMQLGTNGAIASVAMNVTNGSTFDLNGRDATLGAPLNLNVYLTGATLKSGAGTISLNALGVTVSSAANANSSTISGNLNLGGVTNTFNVADGAAAEDLVVSAAVSNGGIIKTNTGVLVLSGANTYSGGTTIGQGTLQIGNGGTSGSLAGAIINNGSLIFNRSDNLTNSGAISGNGNLIKLGAGTLSLSASNSYTGGTTVSNGVLSAGTNNAIGTNSAVTVSGGTLNMGSYTNTVASITMGSGTLAMAANKTSAVQLASTGTAALGSSATLDLTGMSTSAGVYKLLSGSSLTGTFSTVTGLSSLYALKYGTLTANQLDAQHKATIGTITATPASSSIITGGSTDFSITVDNSAPTDSATLSFSATSSTGTIGSVTGPVSVAPQATSSSQAGLSYNGTNVGTNDGLFTVNDSSASVTSGTGTVTVNVYDHASGSLTNSTISLGNLHSDYSSASASVNAANASGYRVNLAGSTVDSNGISFNALSGVTAGSNSAVTATLASGKTAGAISQDFNYTFADDSSLNGASANVGSSTITVTGGVYNYAAAGLQTNIDLGNIHAGGTFGTNSVALTNTATGATGYVENLAAALTNASGVSASGSVSGLQSGVSSSAIQVTIADNTAGAKSGTVGLALTSESIASGLNNSAFGTKTVNVSGFVYTGQGVWNHGSGSWSTFDNWQQAGGTPGIDGALSANDTATFGSGGSGTVRLDGSSPSISALSFSNASSSYAISTGSGSGSLTLTAGVSAASISNAAGTHTINAPLTLGSDVTLQNASGTTLTLAGVVSGTGGLTQAGSGTVALNAAATFTGATKINSGTLALGADGSLASTSIALSGGTLDLSSKTAYTFSGGQSLSGSGSINIGSGTVTVSGNLTPTAMTFNGNINLAGLTTMSINGPTDFSSITATGSRISYGGNIVLNLGSSYNPSAGATFNLFGGGSSFNENAIVSLLGTYTGNLVQDGSTGVYSGIFGGKNYTFKQADGRLQVTAVPEPSTCMLLGIAMTAMVAMIVRRRRDEC